MASFRGANFNMSFPQSGSFQDAASMNQQLYNNIQAAHANRIAQAGAAVNQLQGGYANLSNAVLRRLAGSNRANIQDINDKYTAMSGSVQAQLIARGLGNTSILGDLRRGVASDRAAEVTRSRGLFNQLIAGQQSQIGLAGLGAQMQGIGLMSGLLGDQIGSLEKVMAPYPSGPEDLFRTNPMSGFPGPSPTYAPTGGFGPQSAAFRGGGAGIDFSGGGGGGYGGFGSWATGSPALLGGYADAGYFGGGGGGWTDIGLGAQVPSAYGGDYGGYTDIGMGAGY